MGESDTLPRELHIKTVFNPRNFTTSCYSLITSNTAVSQPTPYILYDIFFVMSIFIFKPLNRIRGVGLNYFSGTLQ